MTFYFAPFSATMPSSLPWPKLFFYSVVALYAYFILRWALRSIRAMLLPVAKPLREIGRRKQAEFARAIENSKRHENPFSPRADVAEYLAPLVEDLAKKLGLANDNPAMTERINSGSDSFLQGDKDR